MADDATNAGNKLLSEITFERCRLVFESSSVKVYANFMILPKSRGDKSLIMSKHFIDFVNGRD